MSTHVVCRRSSCLSFALALCIDVAAAEPLVTAQHPGDWRSPAERQVVRIDFPRERANALRFMIGDRDITGGVQLLAHAVAFVPAELGIGAGETELVIYVADDLETWTEQARVPVRVLTRSGLEVAEAQPRLVVGNRGQLREALSGNTDVEGAGTFQTASLQGGVNSRHARGAWELLTQFNVVGSSDRQEALRFATEGADAPKIDLADYTLEIVHAGSTRLGVGHVSFGSHRLLVDQLAHRGVRLVSTAVPNHEISFAALRGNAIVGYDALLGITSREHRVLGAAWVWTPFPDAGWLPRLELSFSDAEVLPENGFDTGEVRDAERSRGFGVRATGYGTRLDYDLLAARTRYSNPADPLLEGGLDLLPVRSETSNAAGAWFVWRWPELGRLGEQWPVSAEFEGTWDRADPLYRTVGAYVAPDQQAAGAVVRASVGPVGVQFGLREANDNLDDVESLLTTETRDRTASLSIPLGAIAGGPRAGWLPDLAASWQRVRQFAGNVPDPVLSGFAATHLPDQVDTFWSTQASWYRDRFDVQLGYGSSQQDNRQPGRRAADFDNEDLNVALNIRLHPRLVLGLTAGDARNREQEVRLTRKTRAYGINASWQATDRLGFAGAVFDQEETTSTGDSQADFVTADAQINWTFSIRWVATREIPGQLFLRWGLQENSFRDRVFEVDDRSRRWVVNTGFSLSMF